MCFKKLFFYISVIFSFNYQLKAQSSNDCEQTLNQAAQEFTSGHFYGLPSLLKPCLDKFSREQSIRAYLLLTQAYLLVDDPIAAEDSYLKLLGADPEYVASPEKDPIDIVYLSKKFTTRPIFTPRFTVGGNLSLARTIFTLSTDPILIVTKEKPGLGYQLGGGIDWNIDSHFSISLDAMYNTKSFETTRMGVSQNDEQKIIESQSWFDLPLYLKYSREFKRLRPYVYFGIASNLLLSASANATYINSRITAEELLPVENVSGEIFIKNKRRPSNHSLLLGIGTTYKISKNFVSVDLRYMAGLSNLVDIKNNYYENGSTTLATSITRYRWVNDIFRLDNFSVSFSYIIPIYRPRKIEPSGSNNIFTIFRKKKTIEKL